VGIVRRIENDRLAVDLDMTVRGRINAGKQLHAGALTSAVLPKRASTSLERKSKDAFLRAIVPPKAFVT
jgi:hypothetical protein